MKSKIITLCLLFSIDVSFGSSLKKELTSPVTTPASTYFWSGVAATTFLVLTQDSISDPVTEDLSKHEPLGDAAVVGDLYGQLIPNAAYTLGMYGHYYFTENKTSATRAEMMFKASLYSGLTTTVLKYTLRQPRPDNIQEKNSFPSGHTTTAFAFASLVTIEHGWKWGAPALALATLTGVSRMNDGRHFLQDVLAGMTVGVGYGLGVWYAQRGESSSAVIIPILDGQTFGARAVASF
jgi:hypothetical protein